MRVEQIAIIHPNETQIQEIKGWLSPYSSLTQTAAFSSLAQAVPMMSKFPCDMMIVADHFAEAKGAILLKGLRKLCPNAQFVILATEPAPIPELIAVAHEDLNVRYFPQPWDMQGLFANIEAGIGKETPSFAMATVFEEEQMLRITTILDKLFEDTAALSIYLVTSLGQVLDYKGSELKQIGEISSLLGGSFAALQQLGSTFDEHDIASNLIHRQGEIEDLYALGVSNEALLVLRFAVSPTTPRIGTISLYARRAVEELAGVLAATHTKPTSPFGSKDVTDTLDTELDQLFHSDAEAVSSLKSKLLTFTGALKKGLVTKSLINRWDSTHPERLTNPGEGDEK